MLIEFWQTLGTPSTKEQNEIMGLGHQTQCEKHMSAFFDFLNDEPPVAKKSFKEILKKCKSDLSENDIT